MKPKFPINNLVRTADLERIFSKRDSTKWSYKLYKITKNNNDTKPSYLSEIYQKDITNRY